MDWKVICTLGGFGIIGLAIMSNMMSNAAVITLIAGATVVGATAFLAKSPIGEAIAEKIREYKPDQLGHSEEYVVGNPSSKSKKKRKKTQFDIDLEGDIETFVEDLLDGIFPNRRSKKGGTIKIEREKETENGKPKPVSDFPEGLIAVMFTDMEDFTRYVERGDARAFDVLKKHNSIINGSAEHWDGRVVKSYGDGFMIAFTSARKAVMAAVAIQELLMKHNESSLSSEAIRVRIGIDAGEPIKEGDDYIGRTVNLAARIAAAARGGQIFVSSTVKQLVGPFEDLQLIDIGPHSLKGFDDKQTLFEVDRIQAIAHPLESDITRGLAEIEKKLGRDG